MNREPDGMDGNKEHVTDERVFNSLNMEYQGVLTRGSLRCASSGWTSECCRLRTHVESVQM